MEAEDVISVRSKTTTTTPPSATNQIVPFDFVAVRVRVGGKHKIKSGQLLQNAKSANSPTLVVVVVLMLKAAS